MGEQKAIARAAGIVGGATLLSRIFGFIRDMIVAQFFGAPFAILSGGIGCILGVLWISRKWPQLAIYNGDEPAFAGATAD